MVSINLATAASRRRAGRRGRDSAARLWQPLGLVGLGCAGAAVAARLVTPGPLDRFSLAIAMVGIVLGVPHGAVDHLVPFWTAGRRVTLGSLARVLTGYLVIAAAAIAAMVLAPAPTLAVFLAASAWHFGRAEVEFLAERSSRASSPQRDALRAAAHGLTVVALPLAVWHRRTHDIVAALAPPLAGRPALAVFVLLAATALVLDLVLLAVDLAEGRRQEAGETVLLVLLMTVVPPLAAFAVYFGGWHALRHTARLLALPGPDGAPMPVGAALRRYLVHAAPTTVVVLAALVTVASTGSRSVLTSAVVVLIALTFPHMRTVADLDRAARATT